MSDPYGLALVSCVRHQKGYAPLFAARPDIRIVAVTDEPDIPEWMHAVNQDFANSYGVPYERDIARTLDRPDVAMVSVCSEPARHARLAIAAATAGKHIWVDKPMAVALADADRLVAAVEASGVQLSYVHRLHAPAVRDARARIERGELGHLESLHLALVSTGSVVSGAVEDFILVVDKRLSGGGEIMNFFGYPIDTARYLTGTEITHVYASAGTYFFEPHREWGVEDLAIVTLTLAGEITATVVVGRSPTPNHPVSGDMTLRVHGTRGSIVADENRPRVEVRALPPAPVARSTSAFADSMLAPLVDEFIAAIRGDGPPLRSMHDARAIVAVIEATYRSVASGTVESVAPPPARGATNLERDGR